MNVSELRLTTRDRVSLFVRSFLPDGEARAVVQVAHGMAEHSGRYARLARALTKHGYAVYALDHRGHGKTAGSSDDLGFIAAHEGWEVVVGDQLFLVSELKARHPGVPVFLLGHSMGSYIVRGAALRNGSEWAGLLLSGTSHGAPFVYRAARLLAQIERARLGRRAKSPLLRKLLFESFNKRFERRTSSDWLSRDRTEVDHYVSDPLCGHECSTQLWIDVFTGLLEVCSPEGMARLPKTLPVYVLAGEADPLNKRLYEIRRLRRDLEAHGAQDVTVREYPDARHELFNEINRDEVTRELIGWLDHQLANLVCGSKTAPLMGPPRDAS